MKIIVRKEKHDTRYYDASTPMALHKAALLILAERMDPEYAYIVPPSPPDEEDNYTEEQIINLPSVSFREVARGAKKRYDRARREYERDVREWSEAVAAVDAREGVTAVKILQRRARARYEYEGFEIEDVTVAPTALPSALLKRIKKIAAPPIISA